MILDISLINYRNIKKLDINFSKNETLIIGNNGQGKTSIIEAIYFLCIGKTYRTNDLYESINFEEDFSQIKGSILGENNTSHKDNTISNFFISFVKSPRKNIKYKVNDIPKKAFDFIGNFQCVLFSPEDLKIITGSPQERRNFIDSLLIRLDKNYAYLLSLYEKIIRQRNALLKDIGIGRCSENYLDIWDEKYYEYGIKIIKNRLDIIENIKPIINKFYKEISGTNLNMTIDYIGGIDFFNLSKINENRKKDIIIGSSSIGPHRDDLSFCLKQKEMKDFSSQGEIRTGVLSLKYTELEFIQKKQSNITLLLDDVFSELDNDRRHSLIRLAKNYQTIITSTDLPYEYKNILVYKINNGNI